MVESLLTAGKSVAVGRGASETADERVNADSPAWVLP